MSGSLPRLPPQAPPSDGNQGPLPLSQVTEQSGCTDPDIGTIINKAAQFVARHGPEFEKRVIASNVGNAKFKFLNSSDSNHAYYQLQLAEVRAQNQASTSQ